MDEISDHGVGGRSLRDLATSVGSSHRMLIYHFGSRGGLMTAVVKEMEARQRDLLRQASADAASEADMLRATWLAVSDPSARPFVRLFLEVLTLATNGEAGTEGFLETVMEPWLQMGREAAHGFSGASAELDDADLRLDIAVIRGLLIDLLATADGEAAAAALERHIVNTARPTAQR